MSTADHGVPGHIDPYYPTEAEEPYQTVPYASAETPYSRLTDEDIGMYKTAQPHS